MRERERERERDRQTDREGEGGGERGRERETDRQTDRQTEREREREGERNRMYTTSIISSQLHVLHSVCTQCRVCVCMALLGVAILLGFTLNR